MTLLSTLKTRIADDLNRTDLTTQIADAITDAIEFWKNTRFYFNETRSSTFTTTASQARYTSSDDADIPLFFDLDDVFLTDSNGSVILLMPYDIAEMENLQDNSASTGQPYAYLLHEQTFTLYPVPDAAYTVRPIGAIEKAAPASDAESGNVWMTEAFELLRCTAKGYLAAHLLKDPDMAALMVQAEERALKHLRRKGEGKMRLGTIQAMQF